MICVNDFVCFFGLKNEQNKFQEQNSAIRYKWYAIGCIQQLNNFFVFLKSAAIYKAGKVYNTILPQYIICIYKYMCVWINVSIDCFIKSQL